MKKPRLQHDLNISEVLKQLAILSEDSENITNTISRNIGKHPLVYRRARTITEKINELIFLIQEK